MCDIPLFLTPLPSSALEIFLVMRYINLLFTYLLTYLLSSSKSSSSSSLLLPVSPLSHFAPSLLFTPSLASFSAASPNPARSGEGEHVANWFRFKAFNKSHSSVRLAFLAVHEGEQYCYLLAYNEQTCTLPRITTRRWTPLILIT